MKFKIILFISILIILLVYSSEISFMPNFNFRPDKWHLMVPMFGFLIILSLQFFWNIWDKIKNKNKSWSMIILSIISILLFLLLNNPKGNSQNIGYIGLIITAIYTMLTIRFKIHRK